LYQTQAPQAATITYGWKEGKESRSHVEQVAANAILHECTVPTVDKIVDDYVRIEVK